MGLRPGKCYRRKKRAYSRVATKVPRKNFVGAAPALKIRQFNMGNPKKEFSHIVDLRVDDAIQIRDNALESVRITINRHIEKRIGKEAYFFKIRVYPNQLLRERKMAQGAGADRISQGMSHAFGKAIGRAVATRKNQIIMSVLVDEVNITVAKEALKRSGSRLPTTVNVQIHTDVKSIGTKPAKMRQVEEKTEEVKEGEEGKETEKKGEKGKADEKGKDEGKDAGKGKDAEAKKDDKKEKKK